MPYSEFGGTVTRGPVTSVSSSEAPDLRVWLAGSSGGHGDAVPAFTGTAVLTATITISEIRFDPHNAPCSSAEPKRAQVVVVFVPKVRAMSVVYNTPPTTTLLLCGSFLGIVSLQTS